MSAGPDYSGVLRGIQENLAVVNSNVGRAVQHIGAVSEQVEIVAHEQANTRQRLEELYTEFQEFVATDARQKERQFAATRIIEVRQELDKKYGHYDEVRRHTTGILQASDLSIVRKDTMRTSVEELMMSCRGYWLAPALVALACWIIDNRVVAEMALAEAIRRDDSKASLFFSLICRRAIRMEACGIWLLRYFQNQNPVALDREVVEMLNALANGVFGGAALTTCSSVIDEWLSELEMKAGFPEEQRKRWAEALDIKTPKVGAGEYPTLHKYSVTWPQLEAGLASARRNEVVKAFFEQMFTGEIVVPPSLEAAVDGLLDSLVTKYDDEELPLRREERQLQLTVEEGGDKKAAMRRYGVESESFKEQINFAAMLTGAAMNPEQSGATRATQRYAVSRCRQWIVSGFNDLLARDRAKVPAEVAIACGSWKGTSRDGFNEKELSQSLSQQYQRRTEEAVNAVAITTGTYVGCAIAAVLGIIFFASGAWPISLLCLAGAGGFFFYQYSNLETRRQQARDTLERERGEAAKILKAALAELTDLRRETAKEDAKADDVLELLAALSSAQFVLKRPEQARAVVR